MTPDVAGNRRITSSLAPFSGYRKSLFQRGGWCCGVTQFSSNCDQVLCHSIMTHRLEPATKSLELHQQGVSRRSGVLDIRDGVRTPKARKFYRKTASRAQRDTRNAHASRRCNRLHPVWRTPYHGYHACKGGSGISTWPRERPRVVLSAA